MGTATTDADWRGSGAILVVDDEEAVRNVVARALERRGFSVLKARDGQEGLEIFGANQPNIICALLDLTMPRMNGEDTLRGIRRLSPQTPVILMSGYGEGDSADRLAGLGPTGFLQKPFELTALIQAVRLAIA